MADDNVTDLPEQSKGAPKAKTADAIMNEIKAALLKQKAEAFKQKLSSKLQEKEKLISALSICDAELRKMIEEYAAETST